MAAGPRCACLVRVGCVRLFQPRVLCCEDINELPDVGDVGAVKADDAADAPVVTNERVQSLRELNQDIAFQLPSATVRQR